MKGDREKCLEAGRRTISKLSIPSSCRRRCACGSIASGDRRWTTGSIFCWSTINRPSSLSYETILADLGENLIMAASAREALEHLLKHEIAVILVDVCMPELDGFQLAAMIREHRAFRRPRSSHFRHPSDRRRPPARL